jgi:GNAT superfamily N-acetyltransferase
VIAPELREFAEEWDRFTPLSPGMDRVETPEFVLVTGPAWASVAGVRTDDVAATVEEVRAAARTRGRNRVTWSIGPSSRPLDLEQRLRELGLAAPDVNELAALALAHEPEPAPDGVHVRVVDTFADFQIANEIRWAAFSIADDRRAEEEANLELLWETARGGGVALTFLASADGRPAATAFGVFGERGCFLIGGATLPEARGRGLYRALVRARWDEAVRRGTPALAVAADPATSYPILLRLGFTEVCRVRRLEDRL